MKNLTCKTCGSNHFKEEENRYICEDCNASITKTSSKKITFIITLLLLISFGIFMAYKLLYDEKESTSHPLNSETKDYDKSSPFADLILKVETKLGKEIQQNILEEALSEYFKKEKNKAFFVVITRKGEYAFGLSYAAKSTKVAEQEAKDACNKAKKAENIKDDCIPFAINNRVSRLLIEDL